MCWKTQQCFVVVVVEWVVGVAGQPGTVEESFVQITDISVIPSVPADHTQQTKLPTTIGNCRLCHRTGNI